jgi:uncharacterized protein DUF4012
MDDEGHGGLGLADSGSYAKPDATTDSVLDGPVPARTTPLGVDASPSEFGDEPILHALRARARALKWSGPVSNVWTRIKWRPGLRRWGRRRIALLVSVALLLSLALPGVLAVSSALNEYQSLKALGEDGLARLTAVKTDLLGQSDGGSGSPLSGGGSALPGSSTLAELQALLAAPGPDVINPVYTYLAQRQSGTYYPLQVTVNPAKGVASEGKKPATWKATMGENTYFALGGAPKPAPTATSTATAASPTPTPAATGTTGTGSTGAGRLSSRLPDQAHIALARKDLLAAESDFNTLGARLAHPDWVLSLAAVLPAGATGLADARALARVGVDAASAGIAMLDAATPLLLRLHGASSLLSGKTQLITQADISALVNGLTVVSAKTDDIVTQLKTVNVDALPLSARQKALFAQFMPLLPQVKTLADEAVPLLTTFGWIIGADKTRHFLVQTLDRGELRASGGFTGQYAALTLTGGKMGPLTLQDVNCLDYLTGCLSNGWIFGRRPPAPYNTWWPFANWGLRDSNLSADFPTNARLVLSVYQHESGQKMDGLIDISPLVIEDVLRVTGPIKVPLYNETITATNLETKLHYYQQDPAAIALEKKLSGGGRKSFTQLVGQLLLERVKALPLSMMAPLAMQMLTDMRSKNLEVYFTDPAAQALLSKYALDGAVDTTPGVDGYLLVQSNVSVSKATTFITVTQKDNVTLDAKGGATHHLTLTFHGNYTYTQVWGYLTYRDYLRIYVPPNAKLLGGDGFDSGTPMCWPTSAGKAPSKYAKLPVCSGNPYPNDEMVCPSGDYAPGPRAPDVFGSDGYIQWPVDTPGGPTNTTSDLHGRAMYGGYIFVPDGCTATVTLSWYAPGVAPKA